MKDTAPAFIRRKRKKKTPRKRARRPDTAAQPKRLGKTEPSSVGQAPHVEEALRVASGRS